MFGYAIEDLLEWLEWHPHHFGVTWRDYCVGLALLIPFFWMLYKIVLEVIKVNARIREHDMNAAKSIEALEKLRADMDDDSDDDNLRGKKDN